MPRTPVANGSRRRSSRLSKNEGTEESPAMGNKEEGVETTPATVAAADSDSESETEGFLFEGVVYDTYQEMVNAKRKRNHEFLKEKGLLNPLKELAPQRQREAAQKGIKRRKKKAATEEKPMVKRKSNRLAGTPADGRYVQDERGASLVIASRDDSTVTTSKMSNNNTVQTRQERNGRINNGSPLSIDQAVEHCDPKWVQAESVENANQFCKETLKPLMNTTERKSKSTTRSPASLVGQDQTDVIRNKIKELSVDDDNLVAKVTPDRIYSIAAHPSQDTLLVSAGDKQGYVGMWNVDRNSENAVNDGVHLFRFHTRPVNTLEWTPQGLLSSSYDGTVRYFDIANESFEEIFSSDEKEDDFYTQYLCRDHRSNDHSFFLSTSIGSVLHVDRRIGQGPGNITFHADLSEKKINSVSLHRDGYVLATAGLDRTIKFWDLRKFGGSSRGKGTQPAKAPAKGALLGESPSNKSVNSAFFSPSGDYLVTTTMSDSLNIYHKAHLQAMEGTAKKKSGANNRITPGETIRHNNQTGRWLTTFMAQWHPQLDVFCVGSMQKPRAIDVFDGASGEHVRAIQGDALTAVASRCCFHPSADKMILVGGNSSGRVTIIR